MLGLELWVGMVGCEVRGEREGGIHSAPCILARLLLHSGLLGSPFGLWSRSLDRRRLGAYSCCFVTGIGIAVAEIAVDLSSHSHFEIVVVVGESVVGGLLIRVVGLGGVGEVRLLAGDCHSRAA